MHLQKINDFVKNVTEFINSKIVNKSLKDILDDTANIELFKNRYVYNDKCYIYNDGNVDLEIASRYFDTVRFMYGYTAPLVTENLKNSIINSVFNRNLDTPGYEFDCNLNVMFTSEYDISDSKLMTIRSFIFLYIINCVKTEINNQANVHSLRSCRLTSANSSNVSDVLLMHSLLPKTLHLNIITENSLVKRSWNATKDHEIVKIIDNPNSYWKSKNNSFTICTMSSRFVCPLDLDELQKKELNYITDVPKYGLLGEYREQLYMNKEIIKDIYIAITKAIKEIDTFKRNNILNIMLTDDSDLQLLRDFVSNNLDVKNEIKKYNDIINSINSFGINNLYKAKLINKLKKSQEKIKSIVIENPVNTIENDPFSTAFKTSLLDYLNNPTDENLSLFEECLELPTVFAFSQDTVNLIRISTNLRIHNFSELYSFSAEINPLENKQPIIDSIYTDYIDELHNYYDHLENITSVQAMELSLQNTLENSADIQF